MYFPNSLGFQFEFLCKYGFGLFDKDNSNFHRWGNEWFYTFFGRSCTGCKWQPWMFKWDNHSCWRSGIQVTLSKYWFSNSPNWIVHGAYLKFIWLYVFFEPLLCLYYFNQGFMQYILINYKNYTYIDLFIQCNYSVKSGSLFQGYKSNLQLFCQICTFFFLPQSCQICTFFCQICTFFLFNA